jgi:hypothetical protein
MRIALSFVPVFAMLLGCDPAWFQSQTVDLQVTDLQTGEPIPAAKVTIDVPTRLDDSLDRQVITDTSGRASPDIDSLQLGWTWERNDLVTGFRYFTRVELSDKIDVFPVTMEPGVKSDGTLFSVVILSIGPPRLLSAPFGPP